MPDDLTRRDPEDESPAAGPGFTADHSPSSPEGLAREDAPLASAQPAEEPRAWRAGPEAHAQGDPSLPPSQPPEEAGSWRIAPEALAQGYAEPLDVYADVPAALELSFSNADLGLSDRAFERTIPYAGTAERKRRASRARAFKVGRELVETLLLAVIIFFAVKAVVQNFRVEGSSMMPSLQNDQYLLVNKAIYYRVDTHELHKFLPFIPDSNGSDRYLFRAPKRGDVIVFKFPLDTSRDFIKRVIGVPGDTVEIHNGKVFINGSPLNEPYEESPPNYTYGPKTVPPGNYFVLGDNRNNSYDSHAWQQQCSAQQVCDFVPEGNIIGQAWVTYWPWSALGFVNNKTLKPSAP